MKNRGIILISTFIKRHHLIDLAYNSNTFNKALGIVEEITKPELSIYFDTIAMLNQIIDTIKRCTNAIISSCCYFISTVREPKISSFLISKVMVFIDFFTQLHAKLRIKLYLHNIPPNINENLEQQAQALFKAWFVDFEPFGGVMPDDWQDISVYDLADYINGAAFKKAEYGDSGLPIIKIAELKSGITDSTQYCCVRKDDKYYIDDRDILFSWSGNPDTSIDTFLWSRGKAILNQHTFRVVSKYNAPAFTYFLLKYLKPQFAHIASNKQTTGLGHVTVADLKRLQFCSNIATINEFEVLAAPIFNAIFAIYKENQHLADLRDTLLPKLMSGEIDVSAVKI